MKKVFAILFIAIIGAFFTATNLYAFTSGKSCALHSSARNVSSIDGWKGVSVIKDFVEEEENVFQSGKLDACIEYRVNQNSNIDFQFTHIIKDPYFFNTHLYLNNRVLLI